jgi:hypothetical protein
VSGALGFGPSLGASHAALTCVTTTSGQTVCDGASAGLFAGLGFLLFIYIAVAVLGIIAAVMVITKAGYSGWWILIGFVPIVGSIFFLVFAFSTWPVSREVERLRSQVGSGYGRFGDPGGRPSGRAGPGPGSPGPSTQVETNAETVPIPSFGQFLRGETEATSTSGAAPPAQSLAPRGGPPPGWFPSPDGPPGRQRYWDGSVWTDHYH